MMKPVRKTPFNKVDISNLIEMALENKMSWNALANLLKDTTTFDPEKVVEILLKALEKLHLKMQEKDDNYEESLLEGKENIDTNKVGHLEVDSSIGDHHSIKDKSETVEDDIEVLDVVEETMNEEMPVDLKEQTNDFEETSENKNLSVNDKQDSSVIENEWYVFVTNDKESESKALVNTEINIQGNVSEGNEKYVARNEKKESFQCIHCQKVFRASWLLKRHERIHTGELPFECNTCKKRFRIDHHLKRHERIHTGEMPFECMTCKKRFINKSDLRRHERIHTGEAPYECESCKKRFINKSDLRRHERIHTGEVPFECESCKKRFVNKSDLKRHERIHTGEVPYECETCKMRFKDKAKLKVHESVHTGEMPFECKTCERGFTENGKLKRHERIHSGEKPYECKTCNKKFSQSSTLKRHERIHSGEVPFECKIQSIKYFEETSKNSLRRSAI